MIPWNTRGMSIVLGLAIALAGAAAEKDDPVPPRNETAETARFISEQKGRS